jgi:hypothetical protein
MSIEQFPKFRNEHFLYSRNRGRNDGMGLRLFPTFLNTLAQRIVQNCRNKRCGKKVS